MISWVHNNVSNAGEQKSEGYWGASVCALLSWGGSLGSSSGVSSYIFNQGFSGWWQDWLTKEAKQMVAKPLLIAARMNAGC